MPQKNAGSNIYKLGIGCFLLTLVLTAGAGRSSSQGRPKAETITAVTTGSGTQAGQITTIMLIIYEFSTDEDRQILIDAFTKVKIRVSLMHSPR